MQTSSAQKVRTAGTKPSGITRQKVCSVLCYQFLVHWWWTVSCQTLLNETMKPKARVICKVEYGNGEDVIATNTCAYIACCGNLPASSGLSLPYYGKQHLSVAFAAWLCWGTCFWLWCMALLRCWPQASHLWEQMSIWLTGLNWGFFLSGQIFYSSNWKEFSYMLPDTFSFNRAGLRKQLASLKAASCDKM